jgi:poly-gamma-glutamate synthesis protein (capsule biosynthesis protein)
MRIFIMAAVVVSTASLSTGAQVAAGVPAPAAGQPSPAPQSSPAAGQPSPSPTPLYDPRRPPERELENSIGDGFTLAAVGDCIILHPLSPLLKRDAAFAEVVAILRDASVTFGNFETAAVDLRGFRGYPFPGKDDWALVADPGVAKDLKSFGFDLLSRANNHALDYGIDGMRETSRWLDDAGLVHAGAGDARAEARAPRYLQTEIGRVALVSMASTFSDEAVAMPPAGIAPGRPGLSALRTTRTTIVTAPMMRALAQVKAPLDAATGRCGGSPQPGAAAAVPTSAPAGSGAMPDPPRELKVFDLPFRLGDAPGYHYDMNPVDLGEILKSIRLGKQHADFLVATIHTHETAIDCDQPGDFLPALAHAAIDAGADVFLVHGSHLIGPVEIYKGRPIVYGLSNFFWSDIMEPVSAGLYEQNRDLLATAFGDPAKATDADLNALMNATSFNDERVFQSLIMVGRWEEGRLSELRLQPVDLRYGERLTKSGVPRLAPPPAARAIFDRLQRLSQPYGTVLALEKNTVVVKLQPRRAP